MQKKRKKVNTTPEEEHIFLQLMAKYLPYWPLLAIATFLSLITAFVYLRYATPKYSATATLIIKDEKKGYEDSKLSESINTVTSKQLVENEIEVLQSRSLMDSVVKKLMLYAPVSYPGKINSTSAFVTSPIFIEHQDPDYLKPQSKIEFTYDAASKYVTLNKIRKYPLNQVVQTDFGKLKFIPNPFYKNDGESKDFSFSLVNPQKITSAILSALEVTAASKTSTIIELNLKDEIPAKAEAILNELIIQYDKATVANKISLAKKTMAFLDERLKVVGHDMDSLNKQVQQFKSRAGAIDISTQGQIFLQNVGENDQKLSNINAQISVLSQVENYVQSKAGGGSIVPSTLGVTDPMLSQMLDKLYATELEYEKMKKTYGENHPTLIALSDQIAKIRPGIIENVRNQRQGLSATRSNIMSTNGAYNSMLSSMPGKEKALLNLTRDQGTLAGIYQFLLQKKEESTVAFSSIVSDTRVVDNAKAGGSPVSPKKSLIYAISFFIFFLAFLLFITVREFFSGKILYRREIESYTEIPVIGEIAYNETKNLLVVEPGKRTYAAEEFRKIRSSLSYLGINADKKKILVTSSISGEGKSFIAANLAISISATGKKVALVDMDLNKPVVGKLLNMNCPIGVSDYLMGKVAAENIINNVPAFENLSYIAAGTIVDNPSEILLQGNVKKLISFLEDRFDVVMIDTSPIVLVTDAGYLSPMCDATLYIVRHGYTPKIIVKRIDDNNEINPLYNAAIIFNGVKNRGFVKSVYGYGYGYNYMYTYDSETGTKKKKKKLTA